MSFKQVGKFVAQMSACVVLLTGIHEAFPSSAAKAATPAAAAPAPAGAAKPATPLTAAAHVAVPGARPIGLGAASPFRAAPGGVPPVSHAHAQPPKEMEDAADEFDDEDDDE